MTSHILCRKRHTASLILIKTTTHDSAYLCRPSLLKPYAHPHGQFPQDNQTSATETRRLLLSSDIFMKVMRCAPPAAPAFPRPRLIPTWLPSILDGVSKS